MNSTSNVQIFSYLFVLDFGATVFDPQEILEIACLKVGTKSKQVEDSFRQYVRPKYCGRLNGVTMNITGVRQEMVSSAPRFRVAWMKFMNWYLAAKGNHTVAFLTVDSFPINMHLRCQTLLSKMRPSDDFNQWIVLKKVYYKAYDFFPRNLQFMMKELKLPYQGKVENAYGIDILKLMLIPTLFPEIFRTSLVIANFSKMIPTWISFTMHQHIDGETTKPRISVCDVADFLSYFIF